MGKAWVRRLQQAYSLYRGVGLAALWTRVRDRLRTSPQRRAYLTEKAREDAAFDDPAGTDTAGVQSLPGLTIASRNARHGSAHIASPPDAFAMALDLAERDLGDPSGTTFVDLGSGKGRALMMAADRGYGHLVGVEFATELHEIARRSLAKRDVPTRHTLVHGDAADYELPGGPVLLYLYHPFNAQVMARVTDRAKANWQRDKRPIRVAYLNPEHGTEWLRAGWRVSASVPGCAIYAPD